MCSRLTICTFDMDFWFVIGRGAFIGCVVLYACGCCMSLLCWILMVCVGFTVCGVLLLLIVIKLLYWVWVYWFCLTICWAVFLSACTFI